MKGTVKWYNAKKGYGFIEAEGGTDIFVHRSAIPRGVFLREGDVVEFEQEDTEKGPAAIDVRKV